MVLAELVKHPERIHRMSMKMYIPTRQTKPESRAGLRASEEVRLFSEMFYFVAWRLREVLNGPKPRAFPEIRRIEAKGIRDVRNV